MEEQPRRESLNLRVPTDVKHRVVEYAAWRGISINAAVIILLGEALRAEEQKR